MTTAQANTYTFEWPENLWEEIDAIASGLFDVPDDRRLPRRQWVAIAHICVGKADLIDKGYYDWAEADDRDELDRWADDLNEIANDILGFFQPGDGKY